MRRRFAAIAIAALMGCGGSSDQGEGNAGGPGADLVIQWAVGATGLQHSIKAGSTVAWHSSDGHQHDVTSTTAAFARIGVPGGGTSAPARFYTPGSFPYFCSIHGANVQNGTLTVTQ
jgi:plastocyanin